jgi:ATPase family associated with various cellular activities (AAA)
MVNNSNIPANTNVIQQELKWFEEVLRTRLTLHFGQECPYKSIWEITAPSYQDSDGYYAGFISHYKISFVERLVIMLTLVPHIRPQLLDVFFIKNSTYERGFTEFGGLKGNAHSGFLPTVETAFFLIAGTDLQTRTLAADIFESEHYFFRHSILLLHDAASNEPHQSAAISLSKDYVNYFTAGYSRKPHFNKDFPAKLITTQMEWSDLVLPADTHEQIEEIKVWIEHNHTLMQDWGFNKKLKPGYNCLFYGPPGTGKTLVACLLGKQCGMDVYRIDLSMIVSKYIGETEKNLEKVFQLAENKNWILFFDEADALFGKRSGVTDAHDRYANQETAYLLQRIEDFKGVVILATNLKNNIDEAFARRFQTIIYFSVPEPPERLKLWQKSFSASTLLEKKVDLEQLARKHELTGGMIMNVIRYCSLMALKRNENIIRMKDAERGIQKEFAKEGRLYN